MRSPATSAPVLRSRRVRWTSISRHPPSGDWCNTNVGYSTTSYGPAGVTQVNPPSAAGLFPYGNAEILPRPGFVPGMTMTYDIKGAPDMTTHNGTAGWGISNRTMDIVSLEVAWFMYNGSHGPVGAASQLTRPIFNAFGSELPRGFFLMVKRAGSLHPQVKLLDPALLSGDHAYAVKLGGDDRGLLRRRYQRRLFPGTRQRAVGSTSGSSRCR